MNKIDTDIFNKAVALAQAGEKAEAYSQLESIYHFNSTDCNLLLWLAFTTSNLQEAEGRITLAEKLEPNNPNLPGAKSWLAQEKAKQPPPAPPKKTVTFLDLFNNLSGKGLSPSDLVIFNEGLDLGEAGKTQEAYKKLIPLLSRNKDNVDLILAVALTTPNLDAAETLVNRAKAMAGRNQVVEDVQNYIVQQKQTNTNPTSASPNTGSSSSSTPTKNTAPSYSQTPPAPVQTALVQSVPLPFQATNNTIPYSQPGPTYPATQVQPGQIYPANPITTTHVIYHVPQFVQPAIYCLNCGKDDSLQKVSAVYSSGVMTTSSSSLYFDSNYTVGALNGRSVSSSLLAQKLQPPYLPMLHWWIPVCLIVTGLPVMLFGIPGIVIACTLFALALLSLPLVAGNYIKAKEKYKESYDYWNRSYYCNRCDYITMF